VVTVITIRPSSLAPGWREAEELGDAGASQLRQSGLTGHAAQAAIALQPRCCVPVSHLCFIFFAVLEGRIPRPVSRSGLLEAAPRGRGSEGPPYRPWPLGRHADGRCVGRMAGPQPAPAHTGIPYAGC
jgi:hypothetical protein